MELDHDQIEALNAVVQTLNTLPPTAKVRSCVIDVERRWSWRRIRVRITGARSKYDKSFHVTEIRDMG